MAEAPYLADFSLALINRTGAYYVCRDVVESLPHYFSAVRYWRLCLRQEPRGLKRKLLARAMLAELDYLPSVNKSTRNGFANTPTLFFDPLYVLRTDLKRQDLVLCHDVGPITHSHLFQSSVVELYKTAYKLIKHTKPGVVFVSEASKSEFVKLYGTDFRFLKVIPLYVRQLMTTGETTAPPGVTAPFLLTVGAIETRKNHRRIIEAFAKSGLAERGYSYIFCGPRGKTDEDVYALAKATPNVLGFGYLSDAELLWLYGNASGFVLPSLLEGFGVPPLEAAQHGLISIISNVGAQKEAVGESAVTVDPLSVESIAQGMLHLADMPSAEKQTRLDLALQHAKALSYETYIARWSELLESGV